MKRAVALAGAATLSLAALAADQAPQIAPEHRGYAFEYPRVLGQQRLFGIAHGVSLLAAACLDVPAASEEMQNAYTAWRTRQQPAIDGAIAELSVYYFGDDASAADWQSLARTLRLRDELDYPPESAELQAACATLPQALAKPRYDLAARFRLEERMAITVAAHEIETRDRYCRAQFRDDMLRIHEARYETWSEINGPLRQEAAATLEREWPEDAPAATFADWLGELRRETRVQGSFTDCLDFSASLKRPETALRNVFRLPPPPPATNRK